MSRLESAVSPITPGAGRRMSYYPMGMGSGSTTGDVNATSATPRATDVVDTNAWNVGVIGAPPAGHQGTIYRGRACWKITCGAGSGYAFTINTAAGRPLVMPIATQRGVGSAPFAVDDFACWEYSAIVAWDAFVGNISATGDSGISAACGGHNAIRVDNTAGIEVGPVNANTGQLGVTIQQIDGGGPPGVTLLNPPHFDYRTWNKLAIRFVAPTGSADAVMRVLVNDMIQLSVSYGIGTTLPDQIVGTELGFAPVLVHRQAQGATTTVMYIAARGAVVSYAPTEALLA